MLREQIDAINEWAERTGVVVVRGTIADDANWLVIDLQDTPSGRFTTILMKLTPTMLVVDECALDQGTLDEALRRVTADSAIPDDVRRAVLQCQDKADQVVAVTFAAVLSAKQIVLRLRLEAGWKRFVFDIADVLTPH